MNVSKEILNVVDGLAERFGVVIDWSKDNVYPQIVDLCERFIQYKLACQWIWFAVFVAIFVVAVVLMLRMTKDYRGFTEKLKECARLGCNDDVKSKLGLYDCDHRPFNTP